MKYIVWIKLKAAYSGDACPYSLVEHENMREAEIELAEAKADAAVEFAWIREFGK